MKKILLLLIAIIGLTPILMGQECLARARGISIQTISGEKTISVSGDTNDSSLGTKVSDITSVGDISSNTGNALITFFTRFETFWTDIVIKYGLVLILLGVIWGGFQMIASHGHEGTYKEGLHYINLSLGGLAAIIIPYFLMDFAVKLNSLENDAAGSDAPSTGIEGISGYNADSIAFAMIELILQMAGGVAIMALVIAGAMWVFSGGDEEIVAHGKRAAQYSATGLLVITFAYTLVHLGAKFLFGTDDQQAGDGFLEMDLFNAETYMSVATTAMYIMAPAALVAIMYAAYHLLLNENPEHREHAKKVIFWAIGGLVLSASAYAIIKFLVDFNLGP